MRAAPTLLAVTFAVSAPLSALAEVDFERDVRPILETSCVRCHGASKEKGKFRLDTRPGILKGGETGIAVVPGKAADSALIKYVMRSVKDLEMPPEDEEALAPAQIAVLRAWIDAGAPYPSGVVLKAVKPTVAPVAVGPLPPPVARKVDFVKDVQPIFQASCSGCHGPRKQEAAFRLDHKATVMKGGELGPAIVPGKSAESLLVKMVAGMVKPRMPKEGTPLTAAQIGILRAWIDQGAEFPEAASAAIRDRRDHWAFKAPHKSPLPEPRGKGWVRTPVDAHVLAKLEKEGMAPSPEADKVTLLRRLSLDVVGLPPTIAEVDAFLADKAPNAYDKQVERLLASPHYGERWARHWLDAARYADSDGYEKDMFRWIWMYRDWVIGALNRDLPYDQFVIDQIAGDQLPNPTQDQIVATGFLRNSMINEEGGADPEQFRMDAMFDRMEAIGKAVLGLTIQCAQCHSHKFDPISHDEYYKMFAFLNNDDEPMRVVYTSDDEQKRGQVLRRIRDAELRMQRATPGWKSQMAAWEKRVTKGLPAWTALTAPFNDDSAGGQKFLIQKDGAFLAQGFRPTKTSPFTILKTDLPSIGALQLEVLTDPNLPRGGPGRSYKGTFALSDVEVEAAPADDPTKKAKVKLVAASADYEQAEQALEPNFDDKDKSKAKAKTEKDDKKRIIGPVRFAIDGDESTAWTIDAGPGRRNLDRKAVFQFEKPVANASGTLLTVTLKQKHGGWNADDVLHTNVLGKFRISVTPTAVATADPVPKQVRDILAIPAAKRSSAQAGEVFSHWRTTVPSWKKANASIEALWKQYPEGTTTLVLQSRPGGRETHLLRRGDFLKPAHQVKADVPAVLNPLPPNAPPTRLTFARWMVDRRAPTTARVFVNRIWQAYFGTGIVATAEDFGTQAEAPSHPELLDWLATEWMDRGWRVKDLHRMILLSATYRQASRITPELLARDPANRLLARNPRLRVDGEVVRDVFLATSGLLNPAMGGRSVMPPQPAFLSEKPVSYAFFAWNEEAGADRYRRGIYTFRRRSVPYPLMQTFDAPNGVTSCVRRVRSNTPLQALMTLNETLSVEAAQALARRMLEFQNDRAGTGELRSTVPIAGGLGDPPRVPETIDEQRVVHGFRRVLSRAPSATEQAALMALLARERRYLGEGSVDPVLIATGQKLPLKGLPGGTTPTDLAAYTVVARAVLNVDEAITKE